MPLRIAASAGPNRTSAAHTTACSGRSCVAASARPLIVDPPNGRIPPPTEGAKKRRQLVVDFENALLASTDICKNKLVGCSGGAYGPTSPLRETTPPFYVATGTRGGTSGAINRSDDPEDWNLGERCLGAGLPAFASGFAGFYPRIVQSRGAVSIYYDIGQGWGFQRLIPISNAPHLPATVRQWWGDSRGHLGRGYAGRRCHQLQPEEELPGRPRELAPDRTLRSAQREYARACRDDRRSDGVDATVDRQD